MTFKPACTIELDIRGLRFLYNTIKSVHEQWPPEDTDSSEVEFLADMKSKLYGCIMEYVFEEH